MVMRWRTAGWVAAPVLVGLVTSDHPGRCPKCGMKLVAAGSGAQDHAGLDHGAMGHGGGGGIEREDDMVEVNRLITTATMHWRFLDRTSGTDSPAINWHFTVGGLR